MLFLVAANSSFHQGIFSGCDTRVFEGFLHIFASLHRIPFSFAREASMSALVVKFHLAAWIHFEMVVRKSSVLIRWIVGTWCLGRVLRVDESDKEKLKAI